jgi:hypothetical protein
LAYFQIFGFSPDFANRMMPVIGAWDILVGTAVLLLPVRVLLIWTAVWGLFTALLRPLAGQGWWEFAERAGNFGVPLALVLLAGGSVRMWRPISVRPHLPPTLAVRSASILRLTLAALLIGHGGIGAFTNPPAWPGYFAVLGLEVNPGGLVLVPTVGWLEILLGLVVLVKPPTPAALVFIFGWKVLTEALRPLAGEEFGQFVERGGSYAAPLALALSLASVHRQDRKRGIREVAGCSNPAG